MVRRLGEGSEVVEQNVVFPEQAFEAADVTDRAKGSPENQPVKSAQNPGDLIGMICYKTVHGVLLKGKVLVNTFYFFEDAVSISMERGLAAQRFGCG